MAIAQLSGDYVSEDMSEASAADRSLVVRFSLQPRLDSAATAEAGREIYTDREFITILIPGDKTLTVHRPVMAVDKARFPVHYARFKNDRQQEVTGTPLIGWPVCTESQRKELEYFNVRTVEQLANLADGYASNMMGIVALKQSAQKFIAQSKESAVTLRLNKELAERDTRLAELQEQLELLAAQVQAQKTPDKAKTK